MDSFLAIADPTRRQIVELLALQGQLSATQIAGRFTVTPQAISQHLKILREANWLNMEKRATQRLFSINPALPRDIETWARHIGQLGEAHFDAVAELLDTIPKNSL
jgi:DNA-binding transcriptional ArsR family regulator